MNSLMTRSGLFDDFFRDVAPGFYVRPLHGNPLPTPGQIKLDVRDSGADFVVHAELPGVRKEDIHVSVDGAVVVLSAEVRQHDEQRQEEKLLRSERYFGSVSRALSLPTDVDAERASARFDVGVLTLTLPKKAAGGGARLRID